MYNMDQLSPSQLLRVKTINGELVKEMNYPRDLPRKIVIKILWPHMRRNRRVELN